MRVRGKRVSVKEEVMFSPVSQAREGRYGDHSLNIACLNRRKKEPKKGE